MKSNLMTRAAVAEALIHSFNGRIGMTRKFAQGVIRRAALALALVAGAASANAAVVVFQDNFDTENGGVSQLNYTGFANWTVSNGTVDLVGVGGPWDYWPGNGLYVDMDGTSLDAGRMLSANIGVTAGSTYVLSYQLAGNRRINSSDSVTVQVLLGPLVNRLVSLNPNDPFTTYTDTFTAAATGFVNLSFEGAGGDNFGMFLDNVKVVKVPEPGALALVGLGLVGLARLRRQRR
jgi:hypothetical protein